MALAILPGRGGCGGLLVEAVVLVNVVVGVLVLVDILVVLLETQTFTSLEKVEL